MNYWDWGGGYGGQSTMGPYGGQSFPSSRQQQQQPQGGLDSLPMMPGMGMDMISGMGGGSAGGGGAGAGGGASPGGSMGSLGPIAAIMAAVAVSKGAEARNSDGPIGTLGRTFMAPSGNQIKEDPKVGMTTALGIPFINNWIMNDKAKKARPEWEGLFGGG